MNDRSNFDKEALRKETIEAILHLLRTIEFDSPKHFTYIMLNLVQFCPTEDQQETILRHEKLASYLIMLTRERLLHCPLWDLLTIRKYLVAIADAMDILKRETGSEKTQLSSSRRTTWDSFLKACNTAEEGLSLLLVSIVLHGDFLDSRLVDFQRTFEKKISQIDVLYSKTIERHNKHFVSKDAERFGERANHCEKSARWWLAGTLIVSAVLLSVLVVYPFAQEWAYRKVFSLTTTDVSPLSLLLSKIALVSVGSYILFICGKSYIAQRHNAEVNRHRENALNTYQNLIDGARTDEHRDFILAHAAACIFAHQPTAYAKEGTGATDAATHTALVSLISKTANRSGGSDS